MTTITADEYRAAAKVLKDHPLSKTFAGELAVEGFEQAAEKVAAQEYARVLGRVAQLAGHLGDPSEANHPQAGTAILSKLAQDGWTPPEGLF